MGPEMLKNLEENICYKNIRSTNYSNDTKKVFLFVYLSVLVPSLYFF